MRYTNLGSSGLQVSRLCLGCMGFGTPQWREWVLAEEPSYMGIVSTVAVHTASELDKLLRAFNKALKTPSGKPSATSHPTRLRQARLQVVLPPVILMGVMSLEPKLFPMASWAPVIGMLMLAGALLAICTDIVAKRLL